MSIYAEVTINLKDGRQVGTSDITQGSIRDAVLDLMEQCIPTEVPCTGIILSEESLVLQEMATVFQKILFGVQTKNIASIELVLS